MTELPFSMLRIKFYVLHKFQAVVITPGRKFQNLKSICCTYLLLQEIEDREDDLSLLTRDHGLTS